MSEKIYVGADHAGFALKQKLVAELKNRFPHVRAAVAWSPEIAELARKHNDANILVLPSRFVSEQEGLEILHTWLDTKFEGGRHQRRVEKIDG